MIKELLILPLMLTLSGCNNIYYDLPPEPINYPMTSLKQRVEVESNDGPSRPYQSSRQPEQVVVR